jgi:hypothetical protein
VGSWSILGALHFNDFLHAQKIDILTTSNAYVSSNSLQENIGHYGRYQVCKAAMHQVEILTAHHLPRWSLDPNKKIAN